MNAAPVQFFTTGFGDWRRLLPPGPVRDFYVQIYPEGLSWPDLPTRMLEACRAWVESDFARADGERLTPIIPILTRPDREVLRPWFDALASHTVAVVRRQLPALQQLAVQFSNRWNPVEHVLTILVLWSINMWVLRRLLTGLLGRHPEHGTTGRYFIWGEELGEGPRSITGIRGFRGTTGYDLCLIVSRIVERPGLKDARRLYARAGAVSAVDLLGHLANGGADTAALARQWTVDDAMLRKWLAEQVGVGVLTAEIPPQVRVPVFDLEGMARIAPVCDEIGERLSQWLLADTTLEPLLDHCSFARCPGSAVRCLLWHNSYYEATDRLIAEGTLPPFPAVAEGEWGVWLTSHLYGRARPDASPPR